MKRILVLALLVFTIQGVTSAQELKPLSSTQLISPYHTIKIHLDYLQVEDPQPEVAARVFDPKEVNRERAIDLAVKLKQVLDARGLYVETEEVSKNPNYTDSLGRNRYYVFPKKISGLYVEKIGEDWYYSKVTVNRIDRWHKETFPYGIDRLLKYLPKLGTDRYLGLYLWQHLGILILVLLSFIIHKIFTIVIEKIIIRILHKAGYQKLAKEVVLPIAKPISFLVIFPILIWLVPVIQLPISLNRYIVLALRAIWPVFAIVFFYRLVDILGIYMVKMAEKTENTLDDQLVPLIRKVLKTFVIILGGLFILNNLDVNITALLAGLSIGGLAFALAAQDTIKNFFGSLMIFIDRPFQVGDWITSGEIDGTVEEVGFRSTRVRTFRNSVVYVPNGKLADSTIDNHGLRRYRRFYTNISLTYDTPPHLIEVFVEGLREVVNQHADTRKDYFEIHFNNMGDSALMVMFYIFFEVPSWTEELRARHEVLLEIVKLADRLGVNFAFPTQTLHVETFPEKAGNSPDYLDDKQVLRKKLEAYLTEDNSSQSEQKS
ncbi:MAG: mechanosensitive ion channel family protein [Bacteroidota bacterium]